MYICNLGNHLAGLRLQVRNDLEKRFREAAMRRFGFGRGALTRAAEQAFERWLSSAKENVRFEGDPVKAIDGILGEMKLNSVELQHSVRKAWASKVSRNVPN
jgi:hypothetical protein